MSREAINDSVITIDDAARAVLDHGFLDVSFDTVAWRSEIPVKRLMEVGTLMEVVERAMDMAIEDVIYPVAGDTWDDYLFKNTMALYDIMAANEGLARLIANGIISKGIAERIVQLVVGLEEFGVEIRHCLLFLEGITLTALQMRAGMESAMSKTGNIAEMVSPYSEDSRQEDSPPFIIGVSRYFEKAEIDPFTMSPADDQKVVDRFVESFEAILHVPAREWLEYKAQSQIAGAKAHYDYY